MELLQEPEIKSTYDKCKYKVKVWEHQFKKKYGRLPSKLDIKEADREIREAYKTYFNLKSAALEESFKDVDGFNSDDDEASKNGNESNISTSNQFNTSSSQFATSSNQYATNSNLLETNSNGLCEINEDLTNEVSNNALEESEIQNTEKTWGEHLNNIEMPSKSTKKSETFNINSSFSQKLFKNSSFSKRNPRKSLSFHQRKSDNNLNASKSFSQPSSQNSETLPEDTQADNISFKTINCDNINITTDRLGNVAQTSINVAQMFLKEQFPSARKVDSGWLDRIVHKTGTDVSDRNEIDCSLSQSIVESCEKRVDYDSDEIIADSDEEEIFHPLKKRKVDVSNKPRLDFSNIFNKNEAERMDIDENLYEGTSKQEILPKQVDILPEQPEQVDNSTKQVDISSKQLEISTKQFDNARKPLELTKDVDSTTQIDNSAKQVHNLDKIDNTHIEVVEKVKKTKKIVRKSNNSKKVVEIKKDSVKSTRKSGRTRKVLVNLNEEVSDPVDPFANSEDDDPEFNPEPNDSKSKTEKSPTVVKRSRSKKQPAAKKEEDEENEVETNYVLEYSVKPRLKTVPRLAIKNVIKAKAEKLQQKEEVEEEIDNVSTPSNAKAKKLEEKIAAGKLNENFVQINIQKKVFVRGKKNMNFSKYKKKMWRQQKKANALCGPNMDMGGCDGGKLICFNCGGEGHFAQKCPNNKGDALLPLVAGEEEPCPFPTLEEASKIAGDSSLCIRKPKNQSEDVVNASDEEDEGEDPFNDSLDEILTNIDFESTLNNIDMQQFVDIKQPVHSYYPLKDDGSIIDTTEEVYEALKLFGHTSFRPGQEQAVMRILSGQSTLVTLSTGSGKSLCYQLPAYLYAKKQNSIALVVSPLVSLMEDQVTGIPAILKAACLHTNKTKTQRDKILDALSSGNLNILLVSPEAIVAGEKQMGFGSLLRQLPPISFACIDEVHCVSQWSYNFRPSYLMLCRILKERLGVSIILGLTATATRATMDSIITHISVPDGRNGVITDKPLPDNLRLTVSKDANRDNALLGLLLSERFENLKSVIIYCIRRQECERIASFLRTSLKSERPTEVGTKKRKKLNVQAEPYHAGLSASRRRTIQKNFMCDDLRIVVATVAFGMGINKADIRAVIHYNLPSNFESYVQEVGRAGRDGLPAHCHLFLDAEGRDANELQRHIFADSVDRHVIRKLLQKIFIPCSCKLTCPKHEVSFSIQETVQMLDIPEENISTLLCYLELHDKRYIEILSPVYTICKIISYGGAIHIRRAAKECPPLAMALVMFADQEKDDNIFEFPVVEVAAAIGWDSGICKHKLKNLEWIIENNQSRRSCLSVQFENLGFRLLAPGNLSGEELDETLDILYDKVTNQEHTALLQLHALHNTVTEVAVPSYRACIKQTNDEKENKLKTAIRDYFDSPNPLKLVDIPTKKINNDLIISDIRALMGMYRDTVFTGRSIARIFFGISTPNFPAVIWGRCKFWRAHINSDFNSICNIAKQEILRLRK